MNSDLLTTRELAARFGVTVETVARWVRERRIPCIRASRRVVRYDLAAVERALQQPVEGVNDAK
jgi:excisionase family DNA binding protein